MTVDMTGNGAVGASYGDLLVTSLVVLGAVCVAAVLAVRFFGRVLATGRARGTHLLDVVARVPLEPRRSLYVVEVAGKTLLVGTSEMGLSVLSELDAAEVKSRVVPRPSFADLVRSAWHKRKGLAAGEKVSSQPANIVEPAQAAAAGIESAPVDRAQIEPSRVTPAGERGGESGSA
jgi:flagellar protein FliO/FliZ